MLTATSLRWKYQRRLFAVYLRQGDHEHAAAAERKFVMEKEGGGYRPMRLSDPELLHALAQRPREEGSWLSALSWEEHSLSLRKIQQGGNHPDVDREGKPADRPYGRAPRCCARPCCRH